MIGKVVGQLACSAELAALRQQLTGVEAERDRALQERQQVLRGNIRVMCRVRPAHQQQQSPSRSPAATAAFGAAHGSCIGYPLEGLLAVHDASTARQREFEFDAVFAPEASQQQVYEEVSPLVRSCADGYNVCIFAYGQTGSGKTYTMDGPADNPGINTRALQELFSIAADEVDHSWSFQVAMLEIYNEAVRDLLAMSASIGGGSGAASAAAVAAAASAHTVEVSGLPAGELPPNMDRVPGLVWRKVSNTAEVQAALREGVRARATAATALNAASSRSHALVSVKVQGVREGKAFTAMMHLVDLAGSERVDKSEVAGQQLKEAQAINKSLSALGDVVAALQRRGAHIPFRNSKLTQVLQDSLSGSSKVLLSRRQWRLLRPSTQEPAAAFEGLSHPLQPHGPADILKDHGVID
ncbi:hypothetical protein OEZ85_005672 [Tetradesmus obliquus]|uniref:Kinesin-like protein n=1 Tax=Tetradesmus obliquus TaxID=3088 RepID=A0ABY8UHW5_TETOB|nr:hypothetical protein OEZ85_005672 [Tetradesmus obliquus]